MTNKEFYREFGSIDPKMIEAAAPADQAKRKKRNGWIKWASMAACFAVILMAVVIVIPKMFGGDDPAPPIDNEYAYEKGYVYHVDEGVFSTYLNGKVIAEDKIGNKIADVSVMAGWKDAAGEWISTENLGAEVYVIKGVSSDVAVALKFIDQGEAVTTTHYYVIMNPSADLIAVEDYMISPIVPNNPGDETSGEVNE